MNIILEDGIEGFVDVEYFTIGYHRTSNNSVTRTASYDDLLLAKRDAFKMCNDVEIDHIWIRNSNREILWDWERIGGNGVWH